MLDGDDECAPFPIGVWCGVGKPSSPNPYLRQFVDESNALHRDGLQFGGKLIDVKIKGFPVDAPAGSFAKGTKSHTARNACPKCKTIGEYYREPGKRSGRETFPDLDAELRTHDDFFHEQPGAKNGYRNLLTVLGELDDIDIIEDFPLDYMHLCCLGVIKKLFSHWLKRKAVRCLNTAEDVDEITRRLAVIRPDIPNDFARKARPLEELCRWKATELRLFLLYLGPVLLKGVLHEDLYNHFMLLHTAMKILSSSETCYKYNTFATKLLRHFVSESPKHYGLHFITYNVHCLIHLPADVLRFGPLDRFSCFPFENFLFSLKKLIRPGPNPLVQLVKRLDEISNCPRISKVLSFHPIPVLSRPHSQGPLLEGMTGVKEFWTLLFLKWRITISHPNNYVSLDDGSIVAIENIVQMQDGSVAILGSTFDQEQPLFNSPCDSNDIFSVKKVGLLSPISSVWSIDCIKYKVFLMRCHFEQNEVDEEENDGFAVYPLLTESKTSK